MSGRYSSVVDAAERRELREWLCPDIWILWCNICYSDNGKEMETTIMGYIRIMEKKMETTIMGYVGVI